MADVQQGREEAVMQQRVQVATVTRAIRRAYGSQSGYGGVERFSVGDIHDFARRLVAEGVRATAEVPAPPYRPAARSLFRSNQVARHMPPKIIARIGAGTYTCQCRLSKAVQGRAPGGPRTRFPDE